MVLRVPFGALCSVLREKAIMVLLVLFGVGKRTVFHYGYHRHTPVALPTGPPSFCFIFFFRVLWSHLFLDENHTFIREIPLLWYFV